MTIQVPAEAAGKRLDQFLVEACELTRSQIRVRIGAGDVLLDDGVPTKPGVKLRGGERIELNLPPPPPSAAIPQDIPIDVVYADEHLLVVNKNADMVVHPSPGHDSGTLVNALLYHYGTLAEYPDAGEGLLRPGIVHRLDRGTSGLLVVARCSEARAGLSAQLALRSMSRHYLALIFGPKIDNKGTFETLYGRHPRDRKRFSSRVDRGKNAVTHWQVRARAAAVALVECRLQTGRTHQIRVHFADHGHPVVGDATYGGVRKIRGEVGQWLATLSHQALHAWKLSFTHPITGEAMHFEVPPPADVDTILKSLFGDDWIQRPPDARP